MSINKKLSIGLLAMATLVTAGTFLAQPAEAHGYGWHEREAVRHEMRVERRIAAQEYASGLYSPYYAPAYAPVGTVMRVY